MSQYIFGLQEKFEKKNTEFNLKLGLNLLILWLKLKKLTIYKISFSSKLLKVLLTLNRYTSSVGNLIILQRLATVVGESRIKEIKYRNKNIGVVRHKIVLTYNFWKRKS